MKTDHPWVEEPSHIGSLCASHMGWLLRDKSFRISAENKSILKDSECIQKLMDNLKSPHRDMRETALIVLSFLTDPTDNDKSLCDLILRDIPTLVALLDDSKEGLRVATVQTIRNLFVGRPKVMLQFKPYLAPMVKCINTFTVPRFLRDHIQNLTDYTIYEECPLPANVNALIN